MPETFCCFKTSSSPVSAPPADSTRVVHEGMRKRVYLIAAQVSNFRKKTRYFASNIKK